VVHDRKGTLWRVQVKTAIGKRRDYGFSGKFAVSQTQLETKKKPDLYFVLALRAGDHWDFLILPRRELLRAAQRGLSTAAGDNSIFTFRFGAAQVLCGSRDFQGFRNHWEEWPIMPTP